MRGGEKERRQEQCVAKRDRAVFNQLSSVWFAVCGCTVVRINSYSYSYSYIFIYFELSSVLLFSILMKAHLLHPKAKRFFNEALQWVFAALPQWMLMTAVNVRAMMYYSVLSILPVTRAKGEIFLPLYLSTSFVLRVLLLSLVIGQPPSC